MKRRVQFLSKKHYDRILNSRAFKNNEDHFLPLEEPGEFDWLNEYREDEQTFAVYVEQSPSIHSKASVVYLKSFAERSSEEASNASQYGMEFPLSMVMEDITEYIKLFVDAGNSKISDVKLLDPKELTPNFQNETKKRENIPKEFICEVLGRSARKSKKKIGCRKPCLDHLGVQVNAIHILKMMKFLKPKDGYDLVGVTNLDLYSSPPDLFLSGFAGGNVCIQSIARYDPFHLEKRPDCEYDTPLQPFPEKRKRRKINTERRRKKIILSSIKTLSHEVMHNFGLGHCVDFQCLMNGSGNLEEDQKAPFFLCHKCLKKLFHFSRFRDPVERYRGLRDFFKKMKRREEVQWLEKRIKYLEEEGEVVLMDRDIIIIDDDEDENMNKSVPARKKRKVM